MKRVYEGILLLALFLTAMYGLGNVDDGRQVLLSAFAMAVIAQLMYKAGMMDRTIRRQK